MKHPSLFWSVFLLCAASMLAAMSWLTQKALELDRAQVRARRQAELEEDISRALWLMDVRLVPVLAREAARPYLAYLPFYATGGQESEAPQRLEHSPLLIERPEFVRLSFQLGPTGRWTSPQVPFGRYQQLALDRGISPEAVAQSRQRLDELERQVSYRQLLEQLPADWTQPIRGRTERSDELVGGKVFLSFDYDLMPQKLEPAQAATDPPSQQATPIEPQLRRQVQTERDLQNRDAAVQAYAQNEFLKQRMGWSQAAVDAVREGVSQPVWIGSLLLLARRVEAEGEVLIQGCWLDWPQIKQSLLGEIADLLPGADLEPIRDTSDIKVSRLLATLPVQLVAPQPRFEPLGWSAIPLALATAWACLLLALAAVGALTFGAMALSERRGAFVSAVTHELRTPLTTFRMYSEMLAHDMVPDRQKQREYLETLRVEADRLAHLVENVLAYARLERNRPRRPRELLRLDRLLEQFRGRLSDRASEAGMKFCLELAQDADRQWVETDAAAVEQILFNLVDNACKYARSAEDRRIHVQAGGAPGGCELRVRDHGSGVPSKERRRLFRPFSKSAVQAADTATGIGLGLALCRRLARQLGGQLEFEPHTEQGAVFVLRIPAAKGPAPSGSGKG